MIPRSLVRVAAAFAAIVLSSPSAPAGASAAQAGGPGDPAPPGQTLALSVPSHASGTVTIAAEVNKAIGSTQISISIDRVEVASCPKGQCTYQWNTLAAADGSHTVSAKAVHKALSTTLITTATVTVANNPSAASVLLDDFEEASLFAVQPAEDDPQFRYLWNQYPGDFYEGPDPGLATLTTETAHDGSQSLQDTVTAGNVYLQFYPNDGTWRFMHEYLQAPSSWKADTFTRMRFWVKVPSTIVPFTGGQANVQLGTYVREPDDTSQGNHYYHFYNLKHTGEWEQVIFDTHPTYAIGAGGGTEIGNVQYPFATSPAWNYFDALTRFYWDGQGALGGYPATFHFDGFELFRGRPEENIDQVYSLHGVYVPATREVSVGWSHPKNDETTIHEVRYAFEDIFKLGWENATPAPNGSVAPPSGAYNVMEYATTQIDVATRSVVFIAIKPQGSDRFRQIALPTAPGIAAPLP